MRFTLLHFAWVAASWCLVGVFCEKEIGPVVTLPHGGSLRGSVLRSVDGRDIQAFRGVPYARPPVGSLRFKAPQPAEPWTGTLDASEDRNICTQRDPYRRDPDVSGEEDCLHLAVYTPKLPTDSSKLLPVMMFLHGGGFMCGSGISAFYGPDILLDQDVVLVGVNYRLGPLGFLSTGDLNCPGNNGLKDQSLALKWIRDNIASFGGDPNLVTLFGESAGGAATDYHMMSDMSRGLFHRGILQSGTALCAWAAPVSPGVALHRAERLADLLGCSLADHKRDWALAIDCLRNKPAENITNAFYEFFEWDLDPMIAFPPVVEPAHKGAFIAEHPRTILARGGGWGSRLPIIAGITKDEGAIKSAPLFGLGSEDLVPELDSDWNRVAPIALYYKGAPREAEISAAVRKFYFGDKQIDEQTRQNVTNLFTDNWFLAGMDETLTGRLQYFAAEQQECLKDNSIEVCAPGGPGGVPTTYLYLFAHRGVASFTEIFGDKINDYGVCHADDLQYLFPVGATLFPRSYPHNTEDRKIAVQMATTWANFAKTGVPSLDWRSLSMNKGAKQEYLKIGGPEIAQMEAGLLTERAAFWASLRPLLTSTKTTSRDEL